MVQEKCPDATIANMPESGHGDCWCQFGTNMNIDTGSGYMNCLLSALDPCLSREDCEAAAVNAGLEIGGGDYDFAGNYGTKGCFAYSSGEYEGMAYFGTGGSQAEMAASVASPKYRISCPPAENQIP